LLLVLDGLDEVWVGENDPDEKIDRSAPMQTAIDRYFTRRTKSYALLTARPEAEAPFSLSVASPPFFMRLAICVQRQVTRDWLRTRQRRSRAEGLQPRPCAESQQGICRE
jgi:hypothetical protein